MQEQGLVVKIEGNTATVRVDKKDECSKCGMCLFPKNASHIDFEAQNDLGVVKGDTVIIQTQKEGKLLGVLLAFLVPLILVGAGVLLGLLVFGNELVALGISVVLVIVWYVVLSFIDKKLKKSMGFKPTIIQKINIEK